MDVIQYHQLLVDDGHSNNQVQLATILSTTSTLIEKTTDIKKHHTKSPASKSDQNINQHQQPVILEL